MERHRRGHVGIDDGNIVIYTSALWRRLNAAASKFSHIKRKKILNHFYV